MIFYGDKWSSHWLIFGIFSLVNSPFGVHLLKVSFNCLSFLSCTSLAILIDLHLLMWQASTRWEKRQAKVLVRTHVFLFFPFCFYFSLSFFLSSKEVLYLPASSFYSTLIFCELLPLYVWLLYMFSFCYALFYVVIIYLNFMHCWTTRYRFPLNLNNICLW